MGRDIPKKLCWTSLLPNPKMLGPFFLELPHHGALPYAKESF